MRTKQNERETAEYFCSLGASRRPPSAGSEHAKDDSFTEHGLKWLWLRCKFLGNSVEPLLSGYFFLTTKEDKWIIAMQPLPTTHFS